MTTRPSQNRPDGSWKYVCPLGGPTGNATPAARPPVSEFESPKLKTAGKLKFKELAVANKHEQIKTISWDI